jgi:hypothetical protein
MKRKRSQTPPDWGASNNPQQRSSIFKHCGQSDVKIYFTRITLLLTGMVMALLILASIPFMIWMLFTHTRIAIIILGCFYLVAAIATVIINYDRFRSANDDDYSGLER